MKDPTRAMNTCPRTCPNTFYHKVIFTNTCMHTCFSHTILGIQYTSRQIELTFSCQIFLVAWKTRQCISWTASHMEIHLFFPYNKLKIQLLVFCWGALMCSHVAQSCLRAKSQSTKIKYFVSIGSRIFFHMVLYDVIFNVSTHIWIWSFLMFIRIFSS